MLGLLTSRYQRQERRDGQNEKVTMVVHGANLGTAGEKLARLPAKCQP